MEEVPGTVQEPSYTSTVGFSTGFRLHEAVRRCHQYYCRYSYCSHRGFCPGIPFRKVTAGTDQIGATFLSLVGIAAVARVRQSEMWFGLNLP